MSGWVPMAAEWWPIVAERLPKPWEAEEVYMDLRWWADAERMGRGKRPGRPALCARWGWAEWKVRTVTASTVWVDRMAPPADLQPTSSFPPAAIQPTNGHTPTIVKESPAGLQFPSSGSPAGLQAVPENDGNTGTSEAFTQHPSHTPNTHSRVSGLAEVMAVYREWHPRVADKAAKDLGMAARVKDHGAEAVIKVIRWAHMSPDTRAQWLRDKKYLGPTLFRPKNFAEYLGLAEDVPAATQGAPALFGPPRLVADPVDAFIAFFQALTPRAMQAPRLAELHSDEAEARRRQAAINHAGWRRWCLEIIHPMDRQKYLNELRNAYRDAA